jgi:hypothetical protein
MKYYEEGAVPLTFAQMREAYLKFGLVVEEMPITYSSAPVKVVHGGVPYTLDCHHDVDDISTKAAKFYIILERHHTDIKRVFEVWQPLISKEMVVMASGGLQLQAFFSTKSCYEGILYLSHIDDGRFAPIEAALCAMGVPVRHYQPDPGKFKGPHTMVVNQRWFETFPDIDNVRIQCESTHRKRKPTSSTS